MSPWTSPTLSVDFGCPNYKMTSWSRAVKLAGETIDSKVLETLVMTCFFGFFKRFIYYLFIYFMLRRVLVVAHRIFVEACGIFCCST